MTIDKAIEILTHFSTDPDAHYFPSLADAAQLGIEALKVRQAFIEKYGLESYILLPGETK